jgi:AcrR family transcriptional regulator
MAAESAIHQLREKRRAGRPDIREDILAATERVLATTSLNNLTAERLMREAGISRRTFYSYFASKFEPVAELHARVIEEFFAVFEPFFANSETEPDAAVITSMLTTSLELWHQHSAIGRAVYEHWHSEPVIGDAWLAFVERFSEALGAEIDRQRQAGLAPPGPNSQELAASLLWATQDIIYVATSHLTPNPLTEQGALDTLKTLWTGAIYGTGRAPALPPT